MGQEETDVSGKLIPYYGHGDNVQPDLPIAIALPLNYGSRADVAINHNRKASHFRLVYDQKAPDAEQSKQTTRA